LLESQVDPDPFVQFRIWFDEAVAAGERQPEAMTVASVDAAGQPSARMVLLRGLDDRGLTFFTNYASPKASELDANPRAAIVFHWLVLQRQVRVTGAVERISAAESDEYWATRPRGSQLSAWASQQSAPVADRATLEAAVAEYEARFAAGPDEDGAVPRPPDWGGYRVLPDMLELWQHRDDRLHDRLRYTRARASARDAGALRSSERGIKGGWVLERLQP
jgi:pyridoxamine 5'-phosphate oxidase